MSAGVSHYALAQTLAALSEPITLVDAKLQLRVDWTEDDVLIQGMITAARAYVETFTNRQLMPVTYKLTLDMFPTVMYQFQKFYDIRMLGLIRNVNPLAIYLPKYPVSSIVSIQYIDTTGVTQTLDPALYIVDLDSLPPRITPALNAVWPDTQNQMSAVFVNFIAGYANGAPPTTGIPVLNSIPGECMAAMRMLIAEMFENRSISVRSKLSDNPIFMNMLYAQKVFECP